MHVGCAAKGNVATMFCFSYYTATNTMASLEDFKPMKAISMKINSLYTGKETIVGYDVLNRGSVMYYLDKPVVWENNIVRLRDIVNKSGDVFIISSAKDFPGIGGEFKKPTYLVLKYGDMVLLFKKM